MIASTFVNILRHHAVRRPDSTALAYVGAHGATEEAWTYAELDLRSRAIAVALRQRAVPGQRVIIFCPAGLNYVAAFFGCLYAGLIAVPAYPPRNERALPRLRALLKAAEVSVILASDVDQYLLRCLDEGSQPIPVIQIDTGLVEAAGGWEEPDVDSDNLAFLQFTSGSTGVPKGVAITHGNLVANERAIAHAFGHGPQTRVAGWLPPFHDMGLIGNILQPIYLGVPSYLMAPAQFLNDPFVWLKTISDFRATTSGGPNFGYDLCVRRIRDDQKTQLDLSSWTVAFNGSEPVHAPTLRRFADAFAQCGFRPEAFYPCYGLAEATLLVSGGVAGRLPRVTTFCATGLAEGVARELAASGSNSRELVSSGVAGSGTTVTVVDPNLGIHCPDGHVGELWVQGASVASGYWGNAEATAAIFQARTADGRTHLRTGDLGFIHRNEIYLTGRRKDLIIIAGRNIHPHDLEALIQPIDPAIRAQGVACFSTEDLGRERIIAVIELERTALKRVSLSDLGQRASRVVAEEAGIDLSEVVFVKPGGIPKTSSGKVQRSRCRELHAAGQLPVVQLEPVPVATVGELPCSQPAADTFASRLRATVARALGSAIDAIPAGPSFALSSLRAAELQYHLEEEFGVTVSIDSLLGSVSLAEVRVALLGGSRIQSSGPERYRHFQTAKVTETQQALFFLNELPGAGPAYHLTRAFRIRGRLDLERLRTSFGQVLERHVVLRWTFVPEPDGVGPRANVHPRESTFAAEMVEDLSDQQLQRRVVEESRRPFDLGIGPLARVLVLEEPAGDAWLIISAHHIVMDFRSLEILLRDWAGLYAGNLSTQGTLPAADQFASFSAWQAEHLWKEGDRLRTYWRGELGGRKFKLDLPFDHLPEGRRSFAGGSASFELNAGTAAAVAVFSTNAKTTEFTVLLASFCVALWHWSGQPEDVGVAVPFHGRTMRGFRDTVGMLVNTLVLAAEMRSDMTFQELVGLLRGKLAGAMEHQHYSFASVVRDAAEGVDPTRPPLVNVLFAFHEVADAGDLPLVALNRGGARLNFGELELESLGAESVGAQFELSLALAKANGSFSGVFEYASDLFTRSTIERLIGGFHRALEAALKQPDRPICSIPALDSSQEDLLLRGFNDNAADYPNKLPVEYLHEQAGIAPDRIALVSGERHISFGYFNRWTNRVATALRHEFGVGPDVVVPIVAERSVEMLVAIWAVIKAGGAYLPIDPHFPPDRIQFLVEDSGSPFVLTDSGSRRAALSMSDPRMLALDDEEWFCSCSDQNLPLVNEPDDLAYVIYTSGSTGNPKGVMIEHAALVNRLEWMQREFKITAADTVLQKTTYTFDVSVWELLLPLMFGAKLVLAQPGGEKDPWYLRDLIERSRVTIVHFVPSMLSAFLRVLNQSLDLPHWRLVVCSGEALSGDLANEFLRRVRGPVVCNLYGPTEAGIDVTYFYVQPGDERIPIGKPVANTQLYVLNAGFGLFQINAQGELMLGGVQLARGYLNRPDLTAERFVPNPFPRTKDGGERIYRTGDLARWRQTGDVEYLGRLDHQVKLRGFRIELGEIEFALSSHEDIAECVVTAVGAGAETELCGYYVSKRSMPLKPEGLRVHLLQVLPEYMVPAHFVALDEMPLSRNGKVDRKALPAPNVELHGSEQYVPPATLTEIRLAALWSELLSAPSVGAEDYFFDLGGHSLKVIDLLARVRQQFDVSLRVSDVFERPSLRTLAELIDQNGRPGGFNLMTVPDAPFYPVSFGQLGLWLASQEGGAAYNMVGSFSLGGEVKIAILQEVIALLVRRHESLRTTFVFQEGELWQRVAAEPAFEFEYQELDEEAFESAIQLAGQQEASHCFNLERGPLLRVRMFRTGAARHQLLVNVHHLVCDGWSVRVLLQELGALYASADSGQDAANLLAPLPMQYRDYSVWQRHDLHERRMSEARRYWAKTLEHLSAPPRLPIDPSASSAGAGSWSGTVEGERYRKLAEFCRQRSTTVFSVLAATVNVLLFRYTGQNDIALGTPALGRTMPELTELVGLFANTLVLRSRIDPLLSFVSFLDQVEAMLSEALYRQDYPYGEVVRELQDLGASGPLFNVMVAMNERWTHLALGGQMSHAGIRLAAQAKFDLLFAFTESTDRLHIHVEYRGGLFRPETVERLATHCIELLDAALSTPERSIGNLEFLSEQERIVLLRGFQAPPRLVPERLLHHVFEEKATEVPDAPAVSSGEQCLSYSVLNGKANRLARVLRSTLEIRPDDRVAILLERSTDFIVSVLAVLKAGGAYVPLDPHQPSLRSAQMLEDCCAVALLTRRPGAVFRSLLPVIELDDVDFETGDPQNLEAINHPGSLAYVLYTSGSTGRPKGVMIEHRSVGNLVAALTEALGGPLLPSRLALVSPFGFDASVKTIFLSLLGGHQLSIVPEEIRSDPRQLGAFLIEAGIHLTDGTPLHLAGLADAFAHQSPPLLRHLLIGGESLPDETAHRFYSCFAAAQSVPRVYNVYGPTECCVDIACDILRPEFDHVTIGRPIQNVHVYILDDQLQFVPIGVIGELCAGGVQVARGYCGQPESTAERFQSDPFQESGRLYRTGDRARWLPDGRIQILGRSDDQLKVRGFRVEPGEIEAALRQCPGVRNAAVSLVGSFDQRELCAWMEMSDVELQPVEVREALKESLPEYLLPTYYVTVKIFPITPNGKIDRSALPAPSDADRAYRRYQAPTTPLETTLARIWEEVLQLPRVGMVDEFLDLGGNSLKAMRVAAMVEDQLGILLPMTQLLKQGTIKTLSRYLEHLLWLQQRPGERQRDGAEYETGTL